MRFFCLVTILTAASAFQAPKVHNLLKTSQHSSSVSSSTTTLCVNTIDIAENAPRDVQTMVEWADNCGVQKAEGFQLTSDDEYGLDVYAMTNQDLPANSPVLFVPEGMILSSNKAVEELRSDEMESAEKIICGVNAESELRQYYLMLKILVEYEKGQDSPWFPWLNSLPRYYSNAASMTPFCYQCLPSLMRKLAMEERSNMNHLMVRQVPFLSVETRGNEALWVWAYQIVYTRSFEIGDDGDLRIVPMGDYFNHGSNYNEVEFACDEQGNFFAQTTYDVPAGSPLRMSYGDPTNPSFLFARYGFLDESSPATFCKIFPPHINKDMEDLGYAQNRMLFYKDTGDVSPEVWDILLYQFLSSTKIGDRRALMKAHMEGDWEAKQALHQEYYPKTSALLLEHIDTFIDQLDRLSAKGDGKDVSEHPRLPLIMKHNEFVRNTFLAVKNNFF
jgi:hypothetical protein